MVGKKDCGKKPTTITTYKRVDGHWKQAGKVSAYLMGDMPGAFITAHVNDNLQPKWVDRLGVACSDVAPLLGQ